MYQKIVIEADIAVNLLIIAIILLSLWTLFIQFTVNKHRLFGHHRHIQCQSDFCHSVLLPLLLFGAGILIMLTYFVGFNFIEIQYGDDWDMYGIVFDADHRKYDFLSVIDAIEDNNNSNNNGMLMVFYYLYALCVPILCYIGYIALCLLLRCDASEMKRINLIVLLYAFLCCNGLDMFLCTAVIFKYVLPIIWQSIINAIYPEFCSEFVPIDDDPSFCDELTVDVALKDVMWIATVLVVVLLTIFCILNNTFNCSKDERSIYFGRGKTDTWDYMKHRGAMRKSSTRSVNETSTDFDIGVVLGKIPYSSISADITE